MTDSQSPRTRSPEHRRAQLLAAARARFVSEGYANTPVSAIVRDAGVAQGTFYLHFESKQAVLAELRREVFRDYATSLDDVLALPLPPDERLVRIISVMGEVVTRNRDLEHVFRTAESADATQRAALEGRVRLARRAATLHADGVREGVFRDEDPELTAQLVVTLFDNILYEAITYRRPTSLEPLVRHAARFVLRAVGVGEARIAQLIAPLAPMVSSGASTPGRTD
jgi:AcrR family transcriptional regulator